MLAMHAAYEPSIYFPSTNLNREARNSPRTMSSVAWTTIPNLSSLLQKTPYANRVKSTNFHPNMLLRTLRWTSRKSTNRNIQTHLTFPHSLATNVGEKNTFTEARGVANKCMSKTQVQCLTREGLMNRWMDVTLVIPMHCYGNPGESHVTESKQNHQMARPEHRHYSLNY